jgi:hypothetical protein
LHRQACERDGEQETAHEAGFRAFAGVSNRVRLS